MAGQTDTSDDLIAELAKLMADSARSESEQRNEATPPRIPGENSAIVPPPAPPKPAGFTAPVKDRPEPSPASSVRIPGERVEPEVAPFEFNFGFGSPKPAPVEPIPVAPLSEPVPEYAQQPGQGARFDEPAFDPEPAPALDHDSLADLIAAELANDSPADQYGAAAQQPGPSSRPVDSFSVPPVFGLGATPPKPVEVPVEEPRIVEEVRVVEAPRAEQPVHSAPKVSADPDPLEEIERLIGPAVNLDRPAAPASALRSLATATLPSQAAKEAPAREAAAPVSVDDAILAAAAATGARVEWVDPVSSLSDGETPEPVAERVRNPRVLGIARAVAGPLVALTLLVAAGLGLFWALGNGDPSPETAPLLVADTTEVKEVPTVDPAAAESRQSVVFNEISGANTGVDEQIVSRDQSDIETVSQVAAPDVDQDGLVNRKVRTVTVRPDGTIVSGDDGLAGAAMLPVDRPDVPEVPGADFSTPDMIANAPQTSTLPAPAAPAETTAPATVSEPGSRVQVVDLSGNPVPGRTTVIPMSRPANLDQMIADRLASAEAQPAPVSQPAASPQASGGVVNSLPPAPTTNLVATPTAQPQAQTQPQAQVQQQPTPAPAAAPVAASSGSAAAYVQLSSQRSEEAARQSAASIAGRFGGLFGGIQPEIVRADLGERGIYYRVLLPTDSRQNAGTICSNIKAAGGDCLIL